MEVRDIGLHLSHGPEPQKGQKLTELAINGVSLGIAQVVSTACHQAQVLKVKVYQAMPIRHVLRMEGCQRDMVGQEKREGRKSV